MTTDDKKSYTVTNPSEFPAGKIATVDEPMVKAAILAPKDYVGTIMELCQGRRGTLLGMEYLGEDRVEIHYTMPLGEIVFDFFDQLKSRTAGLRVASTTSPPASRRPTWSRSTSCCRARRSTRSARSCTATRPTPTAC